MDDPCNTKPRAEVSLNVPTPASNILPDLFRLNDSATVGNAADWQRRRAELLQPLLAIEYGNFPSKPTRWRSELLHRDQIERLADARHAQYRLTALGGAFEVSFLIDLLFPSGTGPFPVMLNGDMCWHYLSDEIAKNVIGRGYILAQFNRLELASDNGKSERISGLYRAYPDGDYGALVAWAWGYHRCVDFLVTLSDVDATKIAIVGHSRGGKASLLAGATDERIALTSANQSGCCGAGSLHLQSPGSETLEHIVGAFPYWFAPALKTYAENGQKLPFDQHFLKALVAPRALLTTEALGDLWANPAGAWHTHREAKAAYRFLNAESRIGIAYRQGTHSHTHEDWQTLLDFADWQFGGPKPSRPFDECPIPGIADPTRP